MTFWVEVSHAVHEDGLETLAVFLHCRPAIDSHSKNWACFADIEFSLTPLRKACEAITWQHIDVFSQKNLSVGFQDFDGWNEIKDAGFGFILNDTIQMNVRIRDLASFFLVDAVNPTITGRPLKSCHDVEAFSYDLLNNSHMSDIIFRVGHKMFFAHRFILGLKSKSFQELLYDTLKEKRETKYDLDPDAFLSVLSFMYRNELVLTETNAKNVLEVANKFNLEAIIATCKKYLADEDPFSLWATAKIESDRELEAVALKQIAEDFVSLSQSDAFLGITRDMLNAIVSRSNLKAKEFDVYKAVIRWAEAECKKRQIEVSGKNKREILGDIIHNIRFPCMTQIEFSGIVSKDEGILTPEETVNVFMVMANPTNVDMSIFPRTPRSSVSVAQ